MVMVMVKIQNSVDLSLVMDAGYSIYMLVSITFGLMHELCHYPYLWGRGSRVGPNTDGRWWEDLLCARIRSVFLWRYSLTAAIASGRLASDFLVNPGIHPLIVSCTTKVTRVAGVDPRVGSRIHPCNFFLSMSETAIFHESNHLPWLVLLLYQEPWVTLVIRHWYMQMW